MHKLGPLVVTLLLLIPDALLQVTSTESSSVGYQGSNTTIICPIQVPIVHPSWYGPSGLKYYDPELGFNPNLGDVSNRITLAVDARSIILMRTERGDAGLYKCITTYESQIYEGRNTLMIRVRPNAPLITATVAEDSNGIRATEGKEITVKCTSQGGYPAPTVVLYKGSSAGEELKRTRTGSLEDDDTYTVALSYTLIPTRQDDRQQLVCRSYYTTSDVAQDSQEESITLYLYLKPLPPIVNQTISTVAGSDVTVRCTTLGSRPAANITWTYEGRTYSPSVTREATINQTFTTVSILQLRVTAADNGQTVLCKVTHNTTDTILNATGTLNVLFPVELSSSTITGNSNVVATGANRLILKCTTGSSNPASVITWTNGTVIISNTNGYTSLAGVNNGIVRSQELTLYPTRYADGNTIYCSVSNGVLQMEDTTSEVLNLHFHPIVIISTPSNWYITEGSKAAIVLPCSVDSKPKSTITWYHNRQTVLSDTMRSSLSYTINDASRSSYGRYECSADNGIAPSDNKDYTIEVFYPDERAPAGAVSSGSSLFTVRPLDVTMSKPPSIIADGKNSMSISCTSGTSNPVSNITWTTGNIDTNTPTISDTTGEYGGMVRTSTIHFKPTREHEGLIVSCEAKNNVTGMQTTSNSTVIDNIRYSPMISTISNTNETEGNIAILKCNASSKPLSNFMWKKGSVTLRSGTGTASYNGLDYIINLVNRSHTGIYTCTAENTISPNDAKHTRLIVQYPPDVVVAATNTSVLSSSAVITCEASGVPDHYTYGIWAHAWWNGQAVLRKDPLPATRSLIITELTYAHSGIYTCGASNGVKGLSTGSGSLLVQSFPVLTGAIATSKEIKIPGELNHSAVASFRYYSNAGIGSVKVYSKNAVRKEVGEVRVRNVDIKLPVFQSEITTTGREATVTLALKTESQFGTYAIIVTNEIGGIELSLVIQQTDQDQIDSTFPFGVFAGGVGVGVLICLVVVASIVFLKRKRTFSTFIGKRNVKKKCDKRDSGSHFKGTNDNALGMCCRNQSLIDQIDKHVVPTGNTDTAGLDTDEPSQGGQQYEELQATHDKRVYDQLDRTIGHQHTYENSGQSPYQSLQQCEENETRTYDQVQHQERRPAVYENLNVTSAV